MSAGGTPGEDEHPRTRRPVLGAAPDAPAATRAGHGGLDRLDDLLNGPRRPPEQSAGAVRATPPGIPAHAGVPAPAGAAMQDSVAAPEGAAPDGRPGPTNPPTAPPLGTGPAGFLDAAGTRDPAWHGEPGAEEWKPSATRGDGPGPAHPAEQPRPISGRIARGVGELMITAGVVIVLFLAYQLWITGIFASRAQDQIRHDLTTAWARQTPPRPQPDAPAPRAAVPPVELGDGVAVLRVPRFGADYAPVVVEGVTPEMLRRGPGHFPGTAMPGGIGNFVVSGHRTTYGKPFSRVDELKVGDPVVVEVADRYFTYRVTGSEIVDPHRLDVTYPVPGHLGEIPTRSLMTLTTCHPRFSAKSRLIVYAELDETRDKSQGPPPVLTDTRTDR